MFRTRSGRSSGSPSSSSADLPERKAQWHVGGFVRLTAAGAAPEWSFAHKADDVTGLPVSPRPAVAGRGTRIECGAKHRRRRRDNASVVSNCASLARLHSLVLRKVCSVCRVGGKPQSFSAYRRSVLRQTGRRVGVGAFPPRGGVRVCARRPYHAARLRAQCARPRPRHDLVLPGAGRLCPGHDRFCWRRVRRARAHPGRLGRGRGDLHRGAAWGGGRGRRHARPRRRRWARSPRPRRGRCGA